MRKFPISADDTASGPDTLSVRIFNHTPDTSVLGRAIEVLDVCDSTNAVARRMLEQGEPPLNGTLIISDYQENGRGRQGARWSAPPGKSLLFSLILYPACGAGVSINMPSSTQLVTMSLALGIVEGLSDQGCAPCTIKWPNDILDARRRKICGILTESVARHDRSLPALITGAGINVHQEPEDFPENLRDNAVSAEMLADHRVGRAPLLQSILERTEQWLGRDGDELFSGWRERCTTIGHMVRVVMSRGSVLKGMATGIASDGALRLRLDSGSVRTIRAGEVEELRAQ